MKGQEGAVIIYIVSPVASQPRRKLKLKVFSSMFHPSVQHGIVDKLDRQGKVYS